MQIIADEDGGGTFAVAVLSVHLETDMAKKSKTLGAVLAAVHAIILTVPITTQALTTGTQVLPGQYDAVGQIGGCSATLISPSQALTAAHCVCPGDRLGNCLARATLELIDVAPRDDPATAFDESTSLTTVRIPGWLRIHPEYSIPSWNLNDFAILDLDYPAYTVAPLVQPIALEDPMVMPQLGETLWLIGYGRTNADCSGPGQKRWLALSTTEVEARAVRFAHLGMGACPGDSGGAVLNSSGRLVAVISWIGSETNTRPIHTSYSWIVGASQPDYNACSWHTVGAQRSHQPTVPWCPVGSFLTQFDLDGDRNLDAHDAPIVGRTRCCSLPYGHQSWGQCLWVPVGPSSLGSRTAWCPYGSYLTQFDLDSDRRLGARNSPIVGQALCCRLGPGAPQRWGSSSWQPVGLQKSHQAGEAWCPGGSFLAGLELDGAGAQDHDAPYVGRALCVRPMP